VGRQRVPQSFDRLEERVLLSGSVVINEIHYHPNIETEDVEFLELTNPGDAAVDLSGASFTSGIDYAFPGGTTLAPGAYLVVARNPTDVFTKWGVTAFGPWSGKLSNEGEKVTLKSATGTTLDEVTYGVGFPWPVTGDYGDSLELINPAFDNNVPGNWRASSLNPQATLLGSQATWRYRKGISEPPANWKMPDFNEASDPVAWQSGPTSIGFGDGDDNTQLTDMLNSYSTIYLRNTFEITGTVPATLTLRLYVDDGAIVYLNGTEVKRAHVTAGTKYYNSLAQDHEMVWETFTLTGLSELLHLGTNTITIHVLNTTLDSSDLSIDAQLIVPAGGSSGATPGARNSDYATATPPLLDHLTQSVQQPAADQDVTISIQATDPEGVQSVVLEYQLVNPGSYIRMTDAAYATNWVSMAMHDDGLNGDATAGDGIYSVIMPAALQTNRRLVRYRITAMDNGDASIRAPYATDPQPNFAYYVYSGVPAWTGANQPGVTEPVTFGTDITRSLPVYQLIANGTDVSNSQWVSTYNDMPFYGTMVYDGVVYDHIVFTNRGEFSTYTSGKNKWAIKFNTGHDFAARDNYGNLYAEKWARIDLNANASPWLMVNRGLAGLDEATSFRLFQLAGVPASNTNYVQWRVVDAASETGADQYSGDMWGLYLAVEHTGGHWLDEHGLEDGNVYKIENSIGDARNLAPDQPADGSDWTTFLASIKLTTTAQTWWQANVNLADYYSFQAINRVVSNVDLRPSYNQVMYHAPDGHWVVVPWDLDMMLVPETHREGYTYLNNMLVYPQLKMEYANRARELLDLLFTDKSRTGGQVAQVVDELARFVDKSDGAGAYLNGWAELDQYMWNYHPRTTSNHKGTFYVTPMNDTRFGGTWTRTLAAADFEGMAQYAIDFMTDTDPNSWTIGDGDQRGYGFNYLEYEAADALIPNTPTVTYTGLNGFPSDRLKFTASAYSDPDSSPFAAMEWRIGEISNPGTAGFNPNAPWKYEINPVWESGELSTYNAQVSIPSGILQQGHTYRARVRFKDSTGRWSHWSNAAAGVTEFAAGQPLDLIQNSLRITELNYHPVDNTVLPGNSTEKNDYEFIEIKNVGSQAINLLNLQFTVGVTFTFGSMTLDPGELGVVVPNSSAFQSRYGTGIKVLGQYAGKLDNAGERIVLLNVDGSTLKDFTYDDTGPGWYPSTDGTGPTLVVRNPASNPDLSDPASWRASLLVGGSPGADETVPVVTGRHVFYNGSSFDGYNVAANTADDGAIATDKAALLPGQTTSFANYTSYANGLNGIMIDVRWLTGTLAASDFVFSAGNDESPAGWTEHPTPTTVASRTLPGGTVRVTMVWDDKLIENQWLQVTLKGGTGSTSGLAADDVFYFGNAIGESGNDPASARVDVVDELVARANATANAAITDPGDFNRDGVVDGGDQLVARCNVTWFMNELRLITAPSVGGPPPAAPAEAREGTTVAVANSGTARQDAATANAAPSTAVAALSPLLTADAAPNGAVAPPSPSLAATAANMVTLAPGFAPSGTAAARIARITVAVTRKPAVTIPRQVLYTSIAARPLARMYGHGLGYLWHIPLQPTMEQISSGI
jgi:hypothetical protein